MKKEMVPRFEDWVRKVLPHGSGFDADPHTYPIDWKKVPTQGSNSWAPTITVPYHVLTGNGYYWGWVNFLLKFNYKGELIRVEMNPPDRYALSDAIEEELYAVKEMSRQEVLEECPSISGEDIESLVEERMMNYLWETPDPEGLLEYVEDTMFTIFDGGD